jgi:transcriptional regulator with XRE-family HTH domain
MRHAPTRRKISFDFKAIMKTVADLCREQSVTIAELAQRSGLDDGRVTAIALGRWTPSPAERKKIADVFGVAIDQIAWGHQTPIQHLYGHGPG